MKKKIVSLVLVAALAFTALVGTTLAYFTDKTEAAKNTFTVGNVDIKLEEPAWTASGEKDAPEVYPGEALAKDPTVTNIGNNPCFVRVKVTGLNQFGNKGEITLRHGNYVAGYDSTNWTLYKGKHLLSFVDNHDVTRVASILNNIRHLPLIYALAFGMPGIPCVYYGSEWGATGRKEDGDPALRACFDTPVFNELSDWIAKLANAKKTSPALQYGNFSSIVLTNEQCVFLREWRGERVLVAINAADYNYSASFNMGCDKAYDLITDREIQLNNGLELPGYSAFFLKL